MVSPGGTRRTVFFKPQALLEESSLEMDLELPSMVEERKKTLLLLVLNTIVHPSTLSTVLLDHWNSFF